MHAVAARMYIFNDQRVVFRTRRRAQRGAWREAELLGWHQRHLQIIGAPSVFRNGTKAAKYRSPLRYRVRALEFFLHAHGNRTVGQQRDGWPGKGGTPYSDVQHSCHRIRPIGRDLDGVGAVWQRTFDQPISGVVVQRVPRACAPLRPYLNYYLGNRWGSREYR